LMTRQYFRNTCLTTNFDKLLESAFTQQGDWECQPIRTATELEYWKDVDDRGFIIKLHGDYDTDNIANTPDETIIIDEQLRDKSRELLTGSGLVVIGTAGYEKSIHTFFDYLANVTTKEKKNVLRFGLLWGVYVGDSRPANPSDEEIEKSVQKNISPEIIRMIERAGLGEEHLFRFFPIWGAGNFMFDLIRATEDKRLIGEAQQYLDRDMRLRNVLSAGGLSAEPIKMHIKSIKELEKNLVLAQNQQSPKPEWVYTATGEKKIVEIRILYGDITSRSMMGSYEFKDKRRAIVSPDDTCLSVGGGVALRLLGKAGPEIILNELAKFSRTEQSSIVVTSGGKLPVHYIFHGAAIKIVETDGKVNYQVTQESVYNTTTQALNQAASLGVGVLWLPLMGTGVARLEATKSLDGILNAVNDWVSAHPVAMTVVIVIYRDKDLKRSEVFEHMKQLLKDQFIVSEKN
jgi:O-acetyl-ADP-ribose deacetylase (regulator of RNase III)